MDSARAAGPRPQSARAVPWTMVLRGSFLVGAGPALRPRQSLRQLGLGGAAGKIELGLGQARDAAEVGAAELGQEQVRSGQVGALQIEPGQAGPRQIGVAEIDAGQL